MTHILIYGCDDGGDMVWQPDKLDCELQSDEVFSFLKLVSQEQPSGVSVGATDLLFELKGIALRLGSAVAQ